MVFYRSYAAFGAAPRSSVVQGLPIAGFAALAPQRGVARLADNYLARSISAPAARLPLRQMLIGAGRGQVVGSPIGPSIMLGDKGPSHAIIL